MKRSGSTLQYNYCRTILEHHAPGSEVAGWINRDFTRARFADDMDRWLRAEGFVVAKSHALLPDAIDHATGGRMVLLYSYRDLRDVAASAIRTFDGVDSMEDAWPILEEGVENFEQLDGRKGTLLQSYERLTEESELAVREIAACLGISLSPAEVNRIVQQNSITAVERQVQAKERLKNWKTKIHPLVKRLGLLRPSRAIYQRWIRPREQQRQSSLVRNNHVSTNKGRSGNWQEVLSQEESTQICTRFAAWMKQAGYEVGSQADAPGGMQPPNEKLAKSEQHGR